MKKIYTFQFVLTLSLLCLGSSGVYAQGGVYFREGFEPETGWPISAAEAVNVTPFKAVTAPSGTWYTFGAFQSNGPTGSCLTQTGGLSHIRFGNLTNAGLTANDSAFVLTPLANAGIFDLTYLNGRTGRRITIYKTADEDANTANWELVAHFPTTGYGACDLFTVPVNDANAKRLKIIARGGTDSDLDSMVMRSVGSLPTKFGTMALQQKNDDVVANWNTYNESNVKGYFLQRSANGSSFEDVSFVSAHNAIEADYSLTDKIKGGGILYYRVKSVDLDGKEGFSPVAKINIDNGLANGVTVVNPVRGNRVEVQLNGLEPGVFQVSLNTISGGRLNTKAVNVQSSRTTVSMDIPGTASRGIQVLTVTGNRFRYAAKIVVE
jgi:hypothetical protein